MPQGRQRFRAQEAEHLAEDLADLENIDDRGIKRVVAGLERRIRRNQELRVKHAGEPARFVDSEMELHEVLRKLMALAGEAALYSQLVAQGCVPLMLELLQHANIDISGATLDLLAELTEADSVEDLEEARCRWLLRWQLCWWIEFVTVARAVHVHGCGCMDSSRQGSHAGWACFGWAGERTCTSFVYSETSFEGYCGSLSPCSWPCRLSALAGVGGAARSAAGSAGCRPARGALGHPERV